MWREARKPMKIKILLLMLLLAVLSLAGCAEHLPEIRINTGWNTSWIDISIGKPYEYKGFDIETTDTTKDVILHFEKVEK